MSDMITNMIDNEQPTLLKQAGKEHGYTKPCTMWILKKRNSTSESETSKVQGAEHRVTYRTAVVFCVLNSCSPAQA